MDLLSLEAEGVLSNRPIESFLRVFKQFAPNLSRGQLHELSMYSSRVNFERTYQRAQ